MYVNLRRYPRIGAGRAAIEQSVRQELLPELQRETGFKGYCAFWDEGGAGVSASIFDDHEAAHRSTAAARQWVMRHQDFFPERGEEFTGECFVHELARDLEPEPGKAQPPTYVLIRILANIPGTQDTRAFVEQRTLPMITGEPGALEATAAKLRRICETVGFLFISGHGVPAEVMRDTFAMAERFHAQPLEAKLALTLDDRMQGYLPYKSSTTRANGLVAVRKPNENEAFFVNPERDPEHPANRWPEALPEFRATTLRCFAALEALALRMLPLYARALDLPPDYFDSLCDRSFSSLRLTHYPPVAYGADEYGIAPHTDSSFITLLAQNPVPGLQIRTQAGEWIDAPVIPDTFVVNTGDVLKQWSNGRFISTPHRAFNKEPRSRYAIPFFFHPNEDTLIDPLPSCVSDGNPPRFAAQTVGEYMAAFRGSNYDHFRQKKPSGATA